MKETLFIDFEEIKSDLEELRCPAHDQSPVCVIVPNGETHDVRVEHCCCMEFQVLIVKHCSALIKVKLLLHKDSDRFSNLVSALDEIERDTRPHQ